MTQVKRKQLRVNNCLLSEKNKRVQFNYQKRVIVSIFDFACSLKYTSLV